MSDRRLRQSFAVDEQDRIVSVREVPRGRACRCRCPRCHEALIARQGDRNKWHFAHENDADCSGGAESALHLAAKQILMKEKRVLLPAIEVRRNRHLFDSRYGAGKTFRPGRELLLDTVSLEHSIGQFRADVYAVTEDGPMIIEIAVTHTVGEEKSKALKQMGIAALEIVLEAARYEEWNWELLAEDVINDPLNRRWLHPLQIKKFEQVALEGAMEDARSKLRKDKLWYQGVPICIEQNPSGFGTIWHPYNRLVFGLLSELSGRAPIWYSKKYRNWSFRDEAYDNVAREVARLCQGDSDRR